MLAALPAALAVLLAYFVGGSTGAVVVGVLAVPLAWFTLGLPGFAAATSVTILTISVLLFAQTLLEPAGSRTEVLRDAAADVRQARRIATSKFEARNERLRTKIGRQGARLGAMSRRLERLERRKQELLRALARARGGSGRSSQGMDKGREGQRPKRGGRSERRARPQAGKQGGQSKSGQAPRRAKGR